MCVCLCVSARARARARERETDRPTGRAARAGQPGRAADRQTSPLTTHDPSHKIARRSPPAQLTPTQGYTPIQERERERRTERERQREKGGRGDAPSPGSSPASLPPLGQPTYCTLIQGSSTLVDGVQEWMVVCDGVPRFAPAPPVPMDSNFSPDRACRRFQHEFSPLDTPHMSHTTGRHSPTRTPTDSPAVSRLNAMGIIHTNR